MVSNFQRKPVLGHLHTFIQIMLVGKIEQEHRCSSKPRCCASCRGEAFLAWACAFCTLIMQECGLQSQDGG